MKSFFVAKLPRIQSDAESLQKPTSAFLLNKILLDYILDTQQTHIPKQPTHDDQILNIDPAPLVHLTQYLN